jgi:hypothetical protein
MKQKKRNFFQLPGWILFCMSLFIPADYMGVNRDWNPSHLFTEAGAQFYIYYFWVLVGVFGMNAFVMAKGIWYQPGVWWRAIHLCLWYTAILFFTGVTVLLFQTRSDAVFGGTDIEGSIMMEFCLTLVIYWTLGALFAGISVLAETLIAWKKAHKRDNNAP